MRNARPWLRYRRLDNTVSRVTNAILAWGCLEEEVDDACPRLAEVNAAIEAMCPGRGGFVDARVGGDWYGGTKCLEADFAVAAFNHFGPEDIWKAIESVSWEYPNEVCLMFCDQDDDQWSMRSFGGTVTPPSVRRIAPGMPAIGEKSTGPVTLNQERMRRG